MLGIRLKAAFAFLTMGISFPAAGQFSAPNPEAFADAEDQQRARSLNQPCTDADEGQGCHRYDGRLIRDAPCKYRIEPGLTGSKPTDQCYKMEAPRRYRGVWVDEFEGQAFIPEGAEAPVWPRSNPRSPAWRKEADRAIAATIWLHVERAHLDHEGQRSRRKFIEFVGRKTRYPGNYGHMGMSGHWIIVDRMISLRECPKSGSCGLK
ncbi:MAG: hypothetical protein U0S50_18285 [Sphingopyxis sp.]|uniref:hypothetical protein n=1 Tax=Sphingopyxis sp. TaxID=1908224 RepID=UPI002ABA9A53|nr:hypothetical protein [Sphingopyxis sp.]MDZ3833739.1 hypothetical protein [Sphingopyxis sp.]